MMKIKRLADRIRSSIPLSIKKTIKLSRVRVFERLGSLRYSRPALYNMEAKIQKYLDIDQGIFVECGANDGYSQSNTYYLEKFRKWSGILIEPVPYLFALYKKMRPGVTVLNCALGEVDQESVEIQSADLVSSIKSVDVEKSSGGNYIKVPCRTISSILDQFNFGKVDLFSLDVEGFEISVLKGLNLDRHQISFILVETSNVEAVLGVLESKYHLVDQFSHHDYLFRRTESKGEKFVNF